MKAAVVQLSEWTASHYDPQAFDASLAECRATPGRLRIRLGIDREVPLFPVLHEVLTRSQRYLDRRNRWSVGARFDRIFAAHRGIHDLEKPLVRADYAHALDTWQWTLRLHPDASLALQVAALYHDIERLVSEPDERKEHRAVDYSAFKRLHAANGARLLRDVLAQTELDKPTFERAVALVFSHEQPGHDVEARALNEADALSFFSLNSAGFFDHYGPAHGALKVEYTLRRLRPAARGRIWGMRLRWDVEAVARKVASALMTEGRRLAELGAIGAGKGPAATSPAWPLSHTLRSGRSGS